MSRRLDIDAATVRAQVADLLAAFPELAGDETLRLDSIEGETDAFALIERALSERREAETMALAISDREGELATRRLRFDRKAEAMKALIKNIMLAGGIDKLTLAEATLSITKGRASVEITEVAELPQGFFALERKPNKQAILASLTAEQPVPGARLVPGKPSLMVRTK